MAAPKWSIVGVNGKFGQVFARLLKEAGAQITGMDLPPAPAVKLAKYLQGDITAPTPKMRQVLSQQDGILLCVAEKTVLAALLELAQIAPPEAVIADIASVKSRIAAAVSPRRSHLSLHPMFGPALDLAGRPICVVSFRENANAKWLLAVLFAAGAKLIHATAESHDRAAAQVQAAAHAALLALMEAAGGSEAEAKLTRELATPVYTALLALAARMTAQDPELYWSIQHDNPFAAGARAALGKSVARIDGETAPGFTALLHRLAKQFDDAGGAELQVIAERIVTAAAGEGAKAER